MRTVRCKCGASIARTSDGFHDCQGCRKCNTTYSGHPDHHKELKPHTPKKQFDRNTGEFSHYVCSVCYERCDEEGGDNIKCDTCEKKVEKQVEIVDGGPTLTVVPYDPIWRCSECGLVHKGLWPEEGCDWCKGDKIAERMGLSR